MRELAESLFERGWLLEETDLFGGEPVVRVPCLTLVEYVRAHNGSGGEQAKETQLREATERQVGVLNCVQPISSKSVMRVTARCKGQPQVDVRENQ